MIMHVNAFQVIVSKTQAGWVFFSCGQQTPAMKDCMLLWHNARDADVCIKAVCICCSHLPSFEQRAKYVQHTADVRYILGRIGHLWLHNLST